MTPHIGQGTAMALEDAFLLSRLLKQSEDLHAVFKKFEVIRRPRIEQLFKMASASASIRKDTGPWGQWVKEWILWVVLKVMPETWRTKPFEYDIMSVDID
jgi:2-polyprenyl-6-methoxyphenol hydroxylase-like FAD-dependent oxidoreductase